jgi:hypothetical protein
MWWAYTILCLVVYFTLFGTYGFLTAFAITFVLVGVLGLVIKWLSSL